MSPCLGETAEVFIDFGSLFQPNPQTTAPIQIRLPTRAGVTVGDGRGL
jgi:hypothetical protein